MQTITQNTLERMEIILVLDEEKQNFFKGMEKRRFSLRNKKGASKAKKASICCFTLIVAKLDY